MFHFSVRVCGRSYAVQRVRLWAGRGLGWFWSHKEAPGTVRYHCGSWVLWRTFAASGGPRVELELGRLALSL